MKIPKNKRRPFPYFGFFIPILIRRDKSFSIIKAFKFTESAIYKFEDADQHDVNKLFGFSIGMHHKNSFRFGWRPNADLTKIEIVAYEYHQGIRIPTIPIREVELNCWYEYSLEYVAGRSEVHYIIMENPKYGKGVTSSIVLKNKLNWGYKLDLYFGGNKKAPHDITIYKK
jgi:hypothetical protein